jgi:O-antigen ligase
LAPEQTIAGAMSSLPIDAADHLTARGTERGLRTILFLATFLQVWLTATPFADLSDPKLLEPVGDGNPIGQIMTLLLTAALGAFVVIKKPPVLLKAVTPVLLLTFLWFACSAVFSTHPGLAARRLVLASFTIFQAAVLLLLPCSREHFAKLLAMGSILVLGICYFGVLVVPDLSVHQSTDLAEPNLAGNWRGFFTHKNGAGAAMALLIIYGIAIVRTLSAGLGASIISLAAVFLVFTESKSPINLLPLALICSVVLTRMRSVLCKLLVALSIPVAVGILTIGSVEFDAVNALVAKYTSDPSFTGRDEIWRFALDHIAQRPVVGFGYQAFWGTSELLNTWNYLESWGYRASDAHNGYLNIAVMTGLIGLAISMAWIFIQPFIDHVRTPLHKVDPALNLMFIQIWLLGLYLSGFESELFNGGSVVWFSMSFSIVGMRFQAATEYAAREA